MTLVNIVLIGIGIVALGTIWAIYRLIGNLWKPQNRSRQILYTIIALLGAIIVIFIYSSVVRGICTPEVSGHCYWAFRIR